MSRVSQLHGHVIDDPFDGNGPNLDRDRSRALAAQSNAAVLERQSVTVSTTGCVAPRMLIGSVVASVTSFTAEAGPATSTSGGSEVTCADLEPGAGLIVDVRAPPAPSARPTPSKVSDNVAGD